MVKAIKTRVKHHPTKKIRGIHYTLLSERAFEQLSYPGLLRLTSVIDAQTKFERKIAIKNGGRLTLDEERIVRHYSKLPDGRRKKHYAIQLRNELSKRNEQETNGVDISSQIKEITTVE